MSTRTFAPAPAIHPPPAGSISAVRKLGADLVLGARLAVGGGRASWTRLVLTALSVGMCVTLLLIAASIGPASAARGARGASLVPATLDRQDVTGQPMLEVHPSMLRSGSVNVAGMDVAILDPAAGAPPGVAALPGPGELVLSPALAKLLASPAGAGLRPRLAGPVVGIIADAGLVDPGDLRFYRGMAPSGSQQADQLAVGWGLPGAAEPLDYLTAIVLIAGTTILIVPLLVLVAMSSRLGGAARDRRLAAMRLVGASGGQIRRIAIGEALVAAAVGLVLGVGGFLLARAFARWIPVDGRTFFPSDLTPTPLLAAATAVLVPVLAVGAAMGALRSVIVEPLGVSRIGRGRPRRIGWRLLVVGAALAAIVASRLLADQFRSYGVRAAGYNPTTLLVAAIALAMVCIPVMVPYLLEKVSGRLWSGGPGWQLAVRRLQLDSGTAGRVCSGIAVVLAGAVALLPLLGYAADQADQTAQLPQYGTLEITDPSVAALTEVPALLAAAVPAARPVLATSYALLNIPGDPNPRSAAIAGCPSVLAMTTAADCRDGDVFAVGGAAGLPAFGSPISVSIGAGPDMSWALPNSMREVVVRPDLVVNPNQLLITPAALFGVADAPLRHLSSMRVFLDPDGAAALDSAQLDAVRNALAGYTWRVRDLGSDGSYSSYTHLGQLLITVRMGLLVGGVLVLLVAALGLVVTAVEQITERRRALALAVAAGVPRAVLARSMLLGAAIPAVLAFVVADLVGLLIPLAVQPLLDVPLHTSPIALLVLTAAGLGLVVTVTALALPALRRLTRPDALRTE